MLIAMTKSPIQEVSAQYQGISAQYGYMLNPAWWFGLQYDDINSSDRKSLTYSKITPSVWYFPQDNLRMGVTVRVDTEPKSAQYSHTERINEILAHIRTMF